LVRTVADENVQKNMNQMSKSLKQVETDVKNAQKDKTADANDKFASTMTISLPGQMTGVNSDNSSPFGIYILTSNNSQL